MEIISLLQKTLLIVVLSLSVLLGLSVLLANRKSKTNVYYFFTALAIAGWVLFGFLAYYQPMVSYRLIMGRLNLFAVALWFVAIYSFILNYPTEQKSWKAADLVFVSVGVILAAISLLTGYVVKDIYADNSLRTWVFGSLITFYYTYAIATATIMIFRLTHSFKKGEEESRKKITYFVWGIALVLLFNIIFNIIYPYFLKNSNYAFLGDLSVVFILGFTAYGITKHHLFNIKVIATESIVIALSIGLLVDTFLSNGFAEGALKGFVWVLATYGGYALIGSVRQEIKQKEHIAKLARDLEKANGHLKELDALKDNFMSMASHELNTPIAAIEGYLSMIIDEKMGGELNETHAKYLGSVYESSKRLAALVKDLLNVSRIESNRVHLLYDEVQIENVINQSIMEVGSKVKEAKHELSFKKPESPLPKTWFDVARTTEIIINLLGNAIKYTESGGKIEVSAKHDDKFITVAVKDNGRGIPKDKQNTVFEKFSQVDVLKDQVKGTGLGMYISKNLVELQRGKIWFESEGEGKGTTFFFTLPILSAKPIDEHEGEGAVIQLK